MASGTRFGRTILAAVLLSGCGHDSATQQHGQAALESSKEAFGHAVKSGARQVAHAGSYVLLRTRDGSVRVIKSTSGNAARVSSDAWITTRLKTEDGVDPDVPVTRVHVRSEGGAVSLEGDVDDQYSAQKAIQLALDTPGVTAMRSELVWPTR